MSCYNGNVGTRTAEDIRTYTRLWQLAHPERVKAIKRKYRLTHKEQTAQEWRVYYQANKEHLKAKASAYKKAHLQATAKSKRKYNAANPERVSEWKKADYQRNREVRIATVRRYASTHKAEISEAHRIYKQQRKADPDVRAKNAIHSSTRRARKLSLPATFTDDQWKAVKKVYNYRCAYCGAKPKRLDQEHVIPLAKGGSHTVENIVPSCPICNSRKGTRILLGPPPVRLML